MPTPKINKIAVYDPTKPVGDDKARLFEARIAEPDTKRGEYDGIIELIVTNPLGRVPRDELRKAAQREARRTGNRKMQVRRIERVYP